MIRKIVISFIIVASVLYKEVDGCFGGRRRRSGGGGCTPRDCEVGKWLSWSGCSHRCGTTGVQTRTRSKTRSEQCGGTCSYQLQESRSCNRNSCKNGGTPRSGRCSCMPGWTGTCCESGP